MEEHAESTVCLQELVDMYLSARDANKQANDGRLQDLASTFDTIKRAMGTMPPAELEEIKSMFANIPTAHELRDALPAHLRPVEKVENERGPRFCTTSSSCGMEVAKTCQKPLELAVPEAERKPYHWQLIEARTKYRAAQDKLRMHGRTILTNPLGFSETSPLASATADLIKAFYLAGANAYSIDAVRYFALFQAALCHDPDFNWWWIQEEGIAAYKLAQAALEPMFGKRKQINILLTRVAFLMVYIRFLTPSDRREEEQEQGFTKVRAKLGAEGRGLNNSMDLARLMAVKVLDLMTVGGKLINEDTADPAKLAAMMKRKDVNDVQWEDYPYAMLVQLSRDPSLDVTLKHVQWALLHLIEHAASWAVREGDRALRSEVFRYATRLYELDPDSTMATDCYLALLMDQRPLPFAESLKVARKYRERCASTGSDYFGSRACLTLARLLLNGADGGATFSREEAESALKEEKEHRKVSDKYNPPLMMDHAHKHSYDLVHSALARAIKKGSPPGQPGRLPCTLLGDLENNPVVFNCGGDGGRTYVYCTACHAKYYELKKCRGCGVATYCSPECQTADWPRHKKECKQLKEGKDAQKTKNSQKQASKTRVQK